MSLPPALPGLVVAEFLVFLLPSKLKTETNPAGILPVKVVLIPSIDPSLGNGGRTAVEVCWFFVCSLLWGWLPALPFVVGFKLMFIPIFDVDYKVTKYYKNC
jgi:hypothetical protein